MLNWVFSYWMPRFATDKIVIKFQSQLLQSFPENSRKQIPNFNYKLFLTVLFLAASVITHTAIAVFSVTLQGSQDVW